MSGPGRDDVLHSKKHRSEMNSRAKTLSSQSSADFPFSNCGTETAHQIKFQYLAPIAPAALINSRFSPICTHIAYCPIKSLRHIPSTPSDDPTRSPSFANVHPNLVLSWAFAATLDVVASIVTVSHQVSSATSCADTHRGNLTVTLSS